MITEKQYKQYIKDNPKNIFTYCRNKGFSVAELRAYIINKNKERYK